MKIFSTMFLCVLAYSTASNAMINIAENDVHNKLKKNKLYIEPKIIVHQDKNNQDGSSELSYQYTGYNPLTSTNASIKAYSYDDFKTHKPDWVINFSVHNSKSMRITGMVLQGGYLYAAGYYTVGLDKQLNNLIPLGQSNIFILQIDEKTGNINWISNIKPLVKNLNAIVSIDSIKGKDNKITVIGSTSAGLCVTGYNILPKSNNDTLEITYYNDGSIASVESMANTLPFVPVKEQENIFQDDILGSVLNFPGDTLSSWAGSEILQKIGITSSTATSAQIGEVINQLDGIQGQLDLIQNDLGGVLGDFKVLYDQAIQNEISGYASLSAFFENYLGSQWVSYEDAIKPIGNLNDLTLALISQNENTVETLHKTFNNTAMVNISAEVKNAITSYNQVVLNLNNKIIAQAQQSNYGANNDLVSLINGYNESLMNAYSNLIMVLQQAYIIQSTIAYLGSYNSDVFSGWDISIPGVNSGQNYLENQQAINNYYTLSDSSLSEENQGLLIQLYNITAQNIISDQFDNSQNYNPDYIPVQAKTLESNNGGMPPSFDPHASHAQPWTNACDVYIWSGVSTSPFTGKYGNNTITAQCQTGGDSSVVSMSLAERYINDTPLDYYYNPKSYPPYPSRAVYQLQPQQFGGDWAKNNILSNVDYDSSIGNTSFNLIYGKDTRAPSATVQLGDFATFPENGSVQIIYTEQSVGNFPFDISWNYINQSLNAAVQYNAPDGGIFPFWLGLQTDTSGVQAVANFQLQCGGFNYLSCKQNPSKDDGSSVICIGGSTFNLSVETEGMDATIILNPNFGTGC